MKVKLVKPNLKNIKQINNLIDDFKKYDDISNGINGSASLLSFASIEEWINYVNEQKVSKNKVPFKQFLVVDEANVVIGFTNLRLELNQDLLNHGGHIGYSISPQYRQKGYGTEVLKQGLEILKKYNINKVLVTCAQDNIASEKVILKNKGVYENTYKKGDQITKRFWIEI
ncbi:hypothetical protein SHELI_v1c10080 [Spiroplasma helicoides]|uniref:N-acetyltransferase domain-containing protein n=1 Tax=Spiroplasma helicoides TaxID=216938 RepID=A0A1B3SLZ5_9MOLU|nr:GNAT family N-acetyltransferase [Spiroplasma helicoides]AOG60955.1 hypothetical protein SHELI_v1c10080 [Spiroplasma helicoides]